MFKVVKKYQRLSLLLGALLWLGAPWARAETDFFREGVSFYKQHEYMKAFKSFVHALQLHPENSEAAYYVAVSVHQMGHLDKAREQYQFVIDHYKGTGAAQQAATNLRQMAAAKSAETAALPRETWVKYDLHGHTMFVDGYVNNKPMTFIFDTGAERCLLTTTQLKQLGLPMPTGSPTGYGGGVGQAEPVPIWNMNINLKIGRLERHNFPVMVSNVPMEQPLLGQEFYRDFEYSIDSVARAITFKHRSLETPNLVRTIAPALTVDSAGHYVFTVPFKKEGDSLIVTPLINGIATPMVFDTGASLCLFSQEEARKAGIVIDGRRPPFSISGIAGKAVAAVGVAANFKLGPIERNNFAVGVSNSATVHKPLLGQDFVGNWQYTIDNQQQVIRFSKSPN